MWGEVTDLLQQAMVARTFPGAAVCVEVRGEVVLDLALGSAEERPRNRLVHPDTPFDVASLTKVLCTAPVAMHLVTNGILDLDAPVHHTLSWAPEDITPRHLLAHTSGLAAWAPLFQRAISEQRSWGVPATRQAMMRWAGSHPPQAPVHSQHVYSDLGMLMLCAHLEALGGERIDRLFEPVRVSDLRWGWPDAAATEDCPVRKRMVVGEVHDLNAAVLGGLSTHAGLFGTARGVCEAVGPQLRAWHGAKGPLDPDVVRHFWSYDSGWGSHRLAWDGVSPGASTAGPQWPHDGVGHTGFTGCTLWVAPAEQVVVAFLSNRIHPLVEGGAVPNAPPTPRSLAYRAFRPQLHTAIVAALRGAGKWRR